MDEIIVEIDNNVEQIESSNNISVVDNNNIPANIIEHEYGITVQKHEYVVTGDDMYIPLSYDDSPQWLKDTINNITDFSLNQKLTEIGALSNTLYGLIAELEVAKNTYTQSIISSSDIDERINTAITTLNSSLADSDATIIDLITTKATPTEASSLALNVLTASINDGEISSLVSNLQNAISTSTSTLSNNIDIVHAEMTGEFNANAEVINSMQAYVGIDEAGASTGTGVSAYLEGSNGVIGSADSKVANNVYVDGNGNSRSKFEYNSSLNISGTSYNSGFGLSNSAGTGVGSEFWINADKFKFTNNGKTGSKSPFTIDATGTVPEITFNGKVSFNNVTDYTSPDISGTINNNNDVFAKRLGYLSYSAMVDAANSGQTIINGGYVNTSLLQANSIVAGMINTDGLIAENISANEIVGKIITGATLNGASINGAVIKASYIDLDGELEVLTNYHISNAMYTANTSLYIDAIHTVTPDEYRIPSLSTIRETTLSVNISANNSELKSKIRSYNCANAGHNLKCVKDSTVFTVSTDVLLFTLNTATQMYNGDYREDRSSGVDILFANNVVSSIFFTYFGDASNNDLTSNGTSRINVYSNGAQIYSYTNNWSSGYVADNPLVPPNVYNRFTVNGINFRLKVTQFDGIEVYIENGTYNFPFVFNNPSASLLSLKTITYPNLRNGAVSSVYGYFNSSLYINNMI